MAKKDTLSRNQSPGYRKLLAHVHHFGFDFHSRNVLTDLFKTFGTRLKNGDLLVELGCGSGLLAGPIMKRGHSYLGVDLSKQMLSIARQQNPSAKFVNASVYEFEIPRCQAVIAFGEIFNFCFDRHVSLAKLKKVFKTVWTSLDRGGMFVFDCAGPGRGNYEIHRHRNFSGDDWALLLTTSEDKNKNTLVRDLDFFVKQNDGYLRDQEKHVLKLFSRQEIASTLRDIGFKVSIRKQIGDDPFPPGLFGIIATKS